MNLIEKTLRLIEWLHRHLARFCLWFFPKAWRFQNRIPLNVRFALAYFGLAGLLVLFTWELGFPWQERGRFFVISDISEAQERYLVVAGHLTESEKSVLAALAAASSPTGGVGLAASATTNAVAAAGIATNAVGAAGIATNAVDLAAAAEAKAKAEALAKAKARAKAKEAKAKAEAEARAKVVSIADALEAAEEAEEAKAKDESKDEAKSKSEAKTKDDAKAKGEAKDGAPDAAAQKPAADKKPFVRPDVPMGRERIFSLICIAAALFCFVSALMALIRRRFPMLMLQAALGFFLVAGFLVMKWCLEFGSILNGADHETYPVEARDDAWTGVFLVFTLVVLYVAPIVVALITRCVRERYRLTIARDYGGEIITGFKTGGKDPRFRTSMYYALIITWLILFGPYLMIWFGWEEPYKLPKGGGEMAVQQQVQVKQVKKKKQKKKKLTVNPWSPYILERMNIDEVKTLEELNEETKDVYVATANKRAGGKGKGTGGWPQGMEDSRIRFIRLEYKGGDWDQDMGKGADYNLLIKFHEWTGMKIARETEHRKIERLKYFPKKMSPPFVFLTGMKDIQVSEREVKVLREYCEKEWGMLFIDNGGGNFDSAVRRLLSRVFPGKGLVDIPNDDPIYQQPFIFPDGAPPFWHHAGYRAMGIRNEGRWLVFYHPGDINDAWKDGHSGAAAEVADQAYKLGVNIMFYAFNKYYRHHYDQDKDVDD